MATNSALDEHIAVMMAENHIPGLALLIARDGVPEIAKGYGLANVEWDIPVTADTVFEIASVTKLFTALAIMMLVAEGRVALETPIRDYLPQVPAAWESARVRHLLNHTSGIPNYTDPPAYWQSTRLDIAREQILGLVIDEPLQFPVGSKWAYSNTGYYLLGMLIEAVSEQSYGDFLQQRIFGPLDMNATRANDPYQIVPRRASGYTWQDGELRNIEYYSNAGTYSAGVILSTVNDLAKWDAALYSDTLLPQEKMREMWTPTAETLPFEERLSFTVGWGWFIFRQFRSLPHRWAGHNGGIKGFSSTVTRFLDSSATVIALLNRDDFARPDMLISSDVLLPLLGLSEAAAL